MGASTAGGEVAMGASMGVSGPLSSLSSLWASSSARGQKAAVVHTALRGRGGVRQASLGALASAMLAQPHMSGRCGQLQAGGRAGGQGGPSTCRQWWRGAAGQSAPVHAGSGGGGGEAGWWRQYMMETLQALQTQLTLQAAR